MTEYPQNIQQEQVRKETPCLDHANSVILENFMARMKEFFETSMGTSRAERVPTTRADEALE